MLGMKLLGNIMDRLIFLQANKVDLEKKLNIKMKILLYKTI